MADNFISSLNLLGTLSAVAPASISTCEVTPVVFTPKAYQDSGFSPSVPVGLSGSQNYAVSSLSKVGIYDIKLVGQYFKDTATFPVRYNNIGISTVYLKLHVYNASLCKIKAPDNVPDSITYQMKNKNPPSSMKLTLPPFTMATDGCIYDRLQHNILS